MEGEIKKLWMHVKDFKNVSLINILQGKKHTPHKRLVSQFQPAWEVLIRSPPRPNRFSFFSKRNNSVELGPLLPNPTPTPTPFNNIALKFLTTVKVSFIWGHKGIKRTEMAAASIQLQPTPSCAMLCLKEKKKEEWASERMAPAAILVFFDTQPPSPLAAAAIGCSTKESTKAVHGVTGQLAKPLTYCFQTEVTPNAQFQAGRFLPLNTGRKRRRAPNGARAASYGRRASAQPPFLKGICQV